GRAGAWDRSDALPNTIRRYGRLKICATLEPPLQAERMPLAGGVRGGFHRAQFRSLSSDSRHYPRHHLAVIVREPEIAAVVAIGQFLVIEAQQTQDRGVKIVDVHLVLDGARSKLICRAVNGAAFDAASGE